MSDRNDYQPDYQRQYIQDHPETPEKVLCNVCEIFITKNNMAHHKKTTGHHQCMQKGTL